MGFLHKLWDETVAGPAPETGLGKLRKYNSFSAAGSGGGGGGDHDRTVPVSRSITIVREPVRTGAVDCGPSSPSSPASSSGPPSPFSPGTPREEDGKKLRRKKHTALDPLESRSPTVYDWIVISALDR